VLRAFNNSQQYELTPSATEGDKKQRLIIIIIKVFVYTASKTRCQ